MPAPTKKVKRKAVALEDGRQVVGSPETIDIGGGRMVTVPVGDYIIISQANPSCMYPMTQQQFEEMYELEP